MKNKPKFKPEITRVRLNPEQAVLTCGCYNTGFVPKSGSRALPEGSVCTSGAKSYATSPSCSNLDAGSS